MSFPRIFKVALIVLCCASPVLSRAAGVLPEPSSRPLQMQSAAEFMQKNVTAEDISHACAEYTRPDYLNRERAARRAICNGFFFGAASAVAIMRQQKRLSVPYCFPSSLSIEQIGGIFMRWSKDRRGLKAYLAAEGVLRSLEEAYPCASTP